MVGLSLWTFAPGLFSIWRCCKNTFSHFVSLDKLCKLRDVQGTNDFTVEQERYGQTWTVGHHLYGSAQRSATSAGIFWRLKRCIGFVFLLARNLFYRSFEIHVPNAFCLALMAEDLPNPLKKGKWTWLRDFGRRVANASTNQSKAMEELACVFRDIRHRKCNAMQWTQGERLTAWPSWPI